MSWEEPYDCSKFVAKRPPTLVMKRAELHFTTLSHLRLKEKGFMQIFSPEMLAGYTKWCNLDFYGVTLNIYLFIESFDARFVLIWNNRSAILSSWVVMFTMFYVFSLNTVLAQCFMVKSHFQIKHDFMHVQNMQNHQMHIAYYNRCINQNKISINSCANIVQIFCENFVEKFFILKKLLKK